MVNLGYSNHPTKLKFICIIRVAESILQATGRFLMKWNANTGAVDELSIWTTDKAEK